MRTTTGEGQVKTRTDEEKIVGEPYTDVPPPTNRTPTPFNWAEDVDAHLTNTATPTTPSRPPRDLSALCLGTRNPWAMLSRRHNRHHRPQLPPCGLPVPNYTTRHPWTYTRLRHHHI